MMHRTLIIDLIVPLFEKINADPDCRQVEIRYSSQWEFELAVLVAKWLMNKFKDRDLKVTITP